MPSHLSTSVLEGDRDRIWSGGIDEMGQGPYAIVDDAVLGIDHDGASKVRALMPQFGAMAGFVQEMRDQARFGVKASGGRRGLQAGRIPSRGIPNLRPLVDFG
jgi:hypothetical protein